MSPCWYPIDDLPLDSMVRSHKFITLIRSGQSSAFTFPIYWNL
jgi:hypothetical protein